MVIQLDDSTPKILLAYLKSPLVSEIEKAIFLDTIETLTTYSLEYKMGKLIGFLNDKLFKNLIEPGVYVPRSLIARRMYLVDLYKGNISNKDCKSPSSYQTERLSNPAVFAAYDAGLQPLDEVSESVINWVKKCETRRDEETKD